MISATFLRQTSFAPIRRSTRSGSAATAFSACSGIRSEVAPFEAMLSMVGTAPTVSPARRAIESTVSSSPVAQEALGQALS